MMTPGDNTQVSSISISAENESSHESSMMSPQKRGMDDDDDDVMEKQIDPIG